MSKFNIFSLIVSLLSLSVIPASVQADQITPNPNPSGSVIFVFDAENSSLFENNGSLIVGGTLNNSGFLNNNLGGSLGFEAGSSTLNNSGTLNNAGKFQFSDPTNGIVNNYNVFVNSNSDFGNYFGFLNNYNTFSNSGTLSVFLLENTGNVTNKVGATLMADALNNSATLNNSGSIRTDAIGSITNSGILNNSGTLNYGAEGTLNNSGILNNSGTVHSGSFLHNSGTLNNCGTLNAALQMDNSGILNNFGSLSIESFAVLDNSGSMNNAGNLNNEGAITGTGSYIQTAGQTINNGSFSQSAIHIEGGSLSGAGTITGDVTIGSGASVNPGNTPGTMTINGDFTSGGTLIFEIAGLGSGLYDMLDINGNADFTGGRIRFNFIDGFHATAGNYWDFFSSDTISGWDNLGFTFNGLGAGLGWNIAHLGSGVERLWIISNPVAPVPEPETYAMLIVGLGLIGLAMRRKAKLTT